jgi:vacuolar protein sorting-associated protein 13B
MKRMCSLNVRKASVVSADSSWEPGFMEMSAVELILRKLLSVSDLTVCLDRRSALGKIEVYEVTVLPTFSTIMFDFVSLAMGTRF